MVRRVGKVGRVEVINFQLMDLIHLNCQYKPLLAAVIILSKDICP